MNCKYCRNNPLHSPDCPTQVKDRKRAENSWQKGYAAFWHDKKIGAEDKENPYFMLGYDAGEDEYIKQNNGL